MTSKFFIFSFKIYKKIKNHNGAKKKSHFHHQQFLVKICCFHILESKILIQALQNITGSN